MLNINEILKNLEQIDVPQVLPSKPIGNGTPSFGIVNSNGNGRRLSFSKALAAMLELEDTVQILPIVNEGCILLGKNLPTAKASTVSLCGDGKKIAYASQIVTMLTKLFKLDFSGRVSHSFRDISFERPSEGEPYVALVRLVSGEVGKDDEF